MVFISISNTRILTVFCILGILLVSSAYPAFSETIRLDKDLGMGIPIGPGDDADLDLCPQGALIIDAFLEAWQRSDYRVMYDLLDGGSKKGYDFEQARFDFEFLKYKDYKISSVRKSGEDFEFILSYGDWKSGDKELKKMLISGKTFKIIMPTRNSPFKVSAESYF